MCIIVAITVHVYSGGWGLAGGAEGILVCTCAVATHYTNLTSVNLRSKFGVYEKGRQVRISLVCLSDSAWSEVREQSNVSVQLYQQ